MKNVDRWEKSTRIGELANAYGDDGTKSTFRYGQRADSGIETEVSASGKAKWVTLGAIVGHKVSNRRDGVVGEGPVGGRFQNQELSQFKYAETRQRSCGPAGKHHQRFVVHVVRWLGGETHPDSAGDAIGGCPKKHPYASNTYFKTRHAHAQVWHGGVSLSVKGFGIDLATRSGWSHWVETKYNFGSKDRHYICGPPGDRNPFRAKRIWSGAGD